MPSRSVANDPNLLILLRAIGARDAKLALRLLARTPALASAALTDNFAFDWPAVHAYTGDTPLHIAAAVYDADILERLLTLGADVHARNRRGARPLHSAAVGQPVSAFWDPQAQSRAIAILIRAGAHPDAVDKNGVAPLHRAVRTRSAAAVKALLDFGADAALRNGSGSTPLDLTRHTTGRGGSSSAESKAQLAQIIRLLEPRGAASRQRSAR